MHRIDALQPRGLAVTRGWRPPIWMLGWALASVILWGRFGADALNQEFYEPDNAMWLVGVRDMLAGQEIWDSVQHRLNPPDGTPMHWARWIMVLIAAPIILLTPLVGATMAEITTAFLWPTALLAVFMGLIVRICGCLGAGDGLRTETSVAGAVVAALAFPVMSKFSPGSFDHHAVELILALVAIHSLLKMEETPRFGLFAGLALGAMMAVAAEGLPIAAMGLLIAGLLWLFRPDTYRHGLGWVGMGFAASSGVFFLIMSPASEWAAPVCDAMSASFVAFGLAGGAVAALLGRGLPALLASTFLRRLATAIALSGAALTALWLLFPDCAGGGYSAMSADMKTYWLAQISEARSPAQLARQDLPLLLGMAGAPIAALVAAWFYISRRWRAPLGWILLGFLVVGWGLFLWQVRGAVFIGMFAIPFGAWAAARARQAWKNGSGRGGVLAFLAAAATATPAAWSAVSEPVADRLTPPAALQDYRERAHSAKTCEAPASINGLKDLPPSVIFNSLMLGAVILQRTDHSVIAAPYHRNSEGLMRMITAMRSDADAARPMVLGTPADFVAVCGGLAETAFYVRHPAGGVAGEETLSYRLSRDNPPDWLEPVPLENTPLRLYRVIR